MPGMDAKTLLREVESKAKARETRIRLYAFAFAAAFALHLVLFASALPKVLLTVGAALCAFLAVSASSAGRRLPSKALTWPVLGAILSSATLPLVPRALSGSDSAPDLIAHGAYWTCIAVCVFGGRLLAERRESELSALWGRPDSLKLSSGSTSLFSAVALGLGALYAFYAAMPDAPVADPALGPLVAALRGSTIVHISILFLFFVIVSYETEAFLETAGDAALLRRIAASIEGAAAGGKASFLRTLLRELEPEEGRREPVRLLLATMDGLDEESSRELASYLQLRRSSRRYVRALIAALPMIGFVGTIIGLSNTLSDLPTAVGSGAAQIDLTGALAGLALKFQTSLLGLLASILCGLGLALLEKKEWDLRSFCALLAARVSR